MTGPDLSRQWSLDGLAVPTVALERNDGVPPELVWRNQLDGLTFRVRDGFLKWSPDSAGIDLGREAERLRWLEGRIPAPELLEHGRGDGGQWLLTRALPGESAVSPRWVSDPETAVRAIAEGLRALHALPVAEVPEALRGDSWFDRRVEGLDAPPLLEDPVVVHGDACAPNTLLGDDGVCCGIVDVGDLGVGDRWADLAIAAMSLRWNYGDGLEPLLLEAYGIVPDEGRAAYYRALWDAES